MKTYYDISIPLSPATPAWPGSEPFKREESQGSAITAKLTMPSHYATHVDAPKHFLFDKKSIDQVPVASLVGTFKVFEVTSKVQIMVKDIAKFKINAGDKILFKTSNSKFVGSKKEFTEHYVSLSGEAAAYLAKKKVTLVGIDYFGIEAKGQPGHPTHNALLKKNIVIVEGLDLKKVPTGTYNGAILPLKIKDGDGAPARAVLWK
jgi:arylformamidase